MAEPPAALSQFALEVAALKQAREEARLPPKVGVLIPTYNRPDLVRGCVLQMAAQNRTPDIICVHQNGHPDSYQWAVDDLQIASKLVWLHTPAKIPQHQWYSIPLANLLEKGCTHFFWADHDDIYLSDHIEAGLEDLETHDFSVSRLCGLLFTKASDFRYGMQVEFTSHAPGGVSSSMCFNRRFAQQLLADITSDTKHQYTDNVVAHETMPKFNCKISERNTCVYHSHEGSVTSNHWLANAFA